MKLGDASAFKEETDMARIKLGQGDKPPVEADLESDDQYATGDASAYKDYGYEAGSGSLIKGPANIEALIVDDVIFGGTLCVKILSCCEDADDNDSDTHGDSDDDSHSDSALHPQPDVEISIRSSTFSDTGCTGRDGCIRWTDLPPGVYQIIACTPEGYVPVPSDSAVDHTKSSFADAEDAGTAHAKESDSRIAANTYLFVNVDAGEVATAEFRFKPIPAVLHVTASFDAGRSSRSRYYSTGLQPINNAPFDVYQDRTHFGSFKTGDGLANGIELPCPGPYSVAGRPTIKIKGRALHLATNHPVLVNATPGGNISVELTYVAETSAVQASASVEWESNGRTQKSTLPGVGFSLLRINGRQRELVRKGITESLLPTILDDLDPGTYMLVMDGPRSRRFKGQVVELFEPREGAITFVLDGGQQKPNLHEFRFKARESVIRGRVINEKSRAGVAGIPVTLHKTDSNDEPITVKTELDGQWEVRGVERGRYIVAIQKFKSGGVTLVPAEESSAEQTVLVTSSDTFEVPDFVMAEDEHVIRGFVYDEDGNPIPHAVVEIRDMNEQCLGTANTQQEPAGFYRFVVEKAGQYYVSLRETPSGDAVKLFCVDVNSPADQDLTISRRGGPFRDGSRSAGNLQNIVQTAFEPISDLASFPVLTEEVNLSSPRSAWPASSGSAPIGAMIETALREVLGWKPRGDDPKGFVGALTQSFTLTEVDGHTESKWVPRTYAVQTDLSGGITGAQASVYKRAQDAVDQSMPLLDGIYPLRNDADLQDIDALRAVVKNQMTEIVRELGIPGGPRVTRVDQAFRLLLGDKPKGAQPDADDVEGQLGILRREFGLRSQPNALTGEPGNLVNTVEEEQNQTNFRILSDYLTGLRASWMNNQHFFVRTNQQPFYGTQLVLLSRGLNVVAESVEEVRFTMDSVMIGPAERQTLEIEFPVNVTLPEHTGALPIVNNSEVNGHPMFVEELLTWVSSFATEEGPRLIQDGGKFAVNNTFLPIVCQLRNLVLGAVGPINGVSLPRGYSTPRVRRALQELGLQLDELAVLASPIQHQIPSQI